LSLAPENLQKRYDAVVVGSGYGGGVAACRLARAGLSVCVLERGRELQPGEYPNDSLGLIGEVQVDLPFKHVGSSSALFDLRVYDDINVAIGCGLGGTSLINAGLALRPDAQIFDNPRWPAQLRADAALQAHFEQAEAMLKPAAYPQGASRLAKLEAIQRSIRGMQAAFSRVPMLVNFEPLAHGVNHVGVAQQPCIGCGDCITGCNYGAKNTVLMNYLPDARRHGAQIFTGTKVTHLERQPEAWRVMLDAGSAAAAVEADIVVLAAGTLGSTEILLRSQVHGLRVSAALGQHFSGNGDMVGLVYNADIPVNAVGFGDRDPAKLEPVGPCSTGLIDARGGRPPEEGYVMVDGSMPGAFAKWLPGLLAGMAVATGVDTDQGLVDKARELARALESKIAGPYSGAVAHSQVCLVVAHDDASGRIVLDGERLDIRWRGVGDQAPFHRANEAMLSVARALGGTYIPNPTWHEWLGRKLITGHPLGGCAIAGDARDGVVDHRGRVFSGDSGSNVHAGLFVMDGAVVPCSLGVNPLLTITALAERFCSELLNADQRQND